MIEKTKIGNRVSAVTLTLITALMVFKFVAGIAGHSGAMVSDAVHSLSDCLTTVLVMVGLNISQKKPDKEHPYGHQRIEAVVAAVMALALLLTAYAIGKAGIENILNVLGGKTLPVPTVLPLIAAVVSILVQEGLYWYARINAKKINSAALLADAWHHRSDALSSVGSLVGIGGAMLGFALMDPIASLVICLMIGWVAIRIGKTAIDQLIDRAADDQTQEQIKAIVKQTPGVLGIDSLRTRLHSNYLYVDLEISVREDLDMKSAHSIAERVHERVEAGLPDVLHCMVHVNPAK